ncbi:MAG: VWA domain-containing protein, partial [Duodenibacillus sp.]|nr:VWA domain-containing protein [Duodenibacillus sp.]
LDPALAEGRFPPAGHLETLLAWYCKVVGLVHVNGMDWLAGHLGQVERAVAEQAGGELAAGVRRLLLERLPGLEDTRGAAALARSVIALVRRQAEAAARACAPETLPGGCGALREQARRLAGALSGCEHDPQVQFDPVELVRRSLEKHADAKALGSHAFVLSAGRAPEQIARVSEGGRKALARARADSARLARGLLGILQSRARSSSYAACSGGRLRTQDLWRWLAGSQKVFERRRERRQADTAVHVLLDASGSMSGAEIEIGLRASLALVCALSAVKRVSPALSTFSTEFEPVIGHGCKRLARAAKAIGAIKASGGTNLVAALANAALRLRQTGARRLVMLVCTDGIADDRGLAAELERQGFVLYGIGIGRGTAQSVRAIFPRSAVIASIGDLQPALFGFAREALLAGIAER